MIERIAQRIGMERQHRTFVSGINDEKGYVVSVWTDRGAMIDTDDLDTYLATGDRPLRVLESMGQDVCLSKHPDQYAAPVWTATRYWTGGPQGVSAEGPTPAAAILALAERLEKVTP